jgi:hypothetical protein
VTRFLALGFGMLLPLAASCDALAAEPPLFTVAELVPRIDELNGGTVRVAGYLADCEGYSCDLYPSKQDAAVWERAFVELRAYKPSKAPPKLPDLPVLGIGSGEAIEGEGGRDAFAFDQMAAPFTNSYVVITGKVDNRCRYKGERGCTDRSPDLDPSKIMSWEGPAPPPPQQASRTE